MTEFISATAYLVIEADVAPSGRIVGAKVDRSTIRPPYLAGVQVAVKVTVKVPKSAFNAAIASVVIEVPEELVSLPDVTVSPG